MIILDESTCNLDASSERRDLVECGIYSQLAEQNGEYVNSWSVKYCEVCAVLDENIK